IAIQNGPTYLRITKDGNIFSAFYKKNLADLWFLMGSATLPQSSNLTVGLGLFNASSYFGSATSEYDYIKMTPYSNVGTWTSVPKYLSGTPTTQGIISWLQDAPAGTN